MLRTVNVDYITKCVKTNCNVPFPLPAGVYFEGVLMLWAFTDYMAGLYGKSFTRNLKMQAFNLSVNPKSLEAVVFKSNE